MGDLDRAGHWKHEWVPLDSTAAGEKFHGHTPAGWKPGGLGGGKAHHEHAAQIEEHAREFSARGQGPNHEKVGYLMGQAASALRGGDKKAALQHLAMAHTHAAGRGGAGTGAVHARGLGYAQDVIAGHMQKLGYKHVLSRALAHEKVGHTGQGLWGDPHRQLPAYIQHIANDLRQRGMPESVAIATAISQCKKWAAGGEGVKPETRAKAAAAVAEWERLKASAHASRNTPMKGGSMSRSELVRDVPLEDYHVVRTGEGDGTGRVVEAYMTVFAEPTAIRDGQGEYEEDIDRSAFNKRIADLERSRNGFAGAKVFYNHGMTIHGSPSDRYSMPVAVCEQIRADTRGPVTRSRYLDTPLGNEVLEMWRSGAITAQSFTGAIIRSSPELRRGQKYGPDPQTGRPVRVRRLELGLKEYGPTPFPAYQGAELVGVRMSPLGTWQPGEDPEPDTPQEDEALPPDGEAAADEPRTLEESHSQRHHQHALYALRSRELREKEGLVF